MVGRWQWSAETCGYPGPTPLKLLDWLPPPSHSYLFFNTNFVIDCPCPYRDLMDARGRPFRLLSARRVLTLCMRLIFA